MKRAARLVALLGALGVGWLLLGSRPRDVTLVYDTSAVPGATAVEVAVRAGPKVLRRARIVVPPGGQVRHPVRLEDGSYELDWRLEAPAGVVSGTRAIDVAGDETIVLTLGR